MDDTLEPLVLAYRAPLVRYLARRVRDRSLAEDLAQETFLRASRSLGDVRDPAAVRAWLSRIARNVAIDHARSPAARGDAACAPLDERTGERAPETVPSPALLGLEQAEMSACVRRYVDAMPATDREVLVLRDVEGLTERQAAARAGCTVGALKVRAHRARQRLRERLDEGCAFERDERGVLACAPAVDPHGTPERTPSWSGS